MEEIRFDDIDGLRRHVSEEFGEFGPEFEVSQQMIDQFAEITGDRQWIHLDVERARRESPFGTTIAHGFLTLSLLPQMNAADRAPFRIVGYGNAANYGSDKLRFLSPVPAGAKIRGRFVLKALDESKPGEVTYTNIATVEIEGSDKPALVAEWIGRAYLERS